MACVLTSNLECGVLAGDFPDGVGGDAPVHTGIVVLLRVQHLQEKEAPGTQLHLTPFMKPVRGRKRRDERHVI